jgi:hypothetical protein
MRGINIFIVLLLICKVQFGQNLLVNPSFEEYNNPSKDIFSARYWLIPNKSSIDYYTEEIPVKPLFRDFTCESPYNQFGFHPPFDGIAYIGLSLFNWSGELEHYTGCLIQPLKKDSIYKVNFYVKYAGDSVWIYSKLIELLFTQEIKFLEWNTNYRYLFKHDKQPQASVKVDIEKAYITRDWIKCTAEYKAQGGEKYMTFGLFYQGDNFIELCNEYLKKYNNFEKQKKFINTHEVYPIFTNHNFNPTLRNKFRVYAYYFIDNVSVTPLKRKENDNTISLK